MKRRDFLKTGIAASGLITGLSDWSFAQTSNSNRSSSQGGGPIIVVFLRGGADGLGILSPLEDPNFLAARPPDIRFAIDKASNPKPLTLDAGRFYWHPAAAPLDQLLNRQRLVPWQAVGIKDETRSHFEAQELIERGTQSLQNLSDPFGWMARQVYLNKGKLSTLSAGLPLFAGNNNMPNAMLGADQVLAMRDLQNGVSFPGGPAGLKALQAMGEADGQHPAAKIILNTFNTLDQVNNALPKTDNKVLPYVSSGSTPYPDSDPGVGLRSVARLVQAQVGLQYAWVDHSSWDTHEGQGWRINYLISQLSNALLAFDEDMQAKNQAYTLVVMTEFGRRLISNKSNGTDHGHGSLSLVMGNKVPGGKMMGRWPGLETPNLDRGVDLAATSDCLAVLKQAQMWHQS